MKNVPLPSFFGANLISPVGLVSSLVTKKEKTKEKKNLLSLSAFLIFRRLITELRSCVCAHTVRITGKLNPDHWQRGQRASGTHTKLKPH